MALHIISLFILSTLDPGNVTTSRHSPVHEIIIFPQTCYGSTLDYSLPSRDISTFWITMTVGLPTNCLIHLGPLSLSIVLQQLNTFSSSILIKPSVNVKHGYYFGTLVQHALIILMLFISGNVRPNPGPVNGDATPITSNMTFNDFLRSQHWDLYMSISIACCLKLIWYNPGYTMLILMSLLSLNHGVRKMLQTLTSLHQVTPG